MPPNQLQSFKLAEILCGPFEPKVADWSLLLNHEGRTHELVDVIAATAINAQAALNWLGARPPDWEEVRRTLAAIARNCSRADEIAVQLQALADGPRK